MVSGTQFATSEKDDESLQGEGYRKTDPKDISNDNFYQNKRCVLNLAPEMEGEEALEYKTTMSWMAVPRFWSLALEQEEAPGLGRKHIPQRPDGKMVGA